MLPGPDRVNRELSVFVVAHWPNLALVIDPIYVQLIDALALLDDQLMHRYVPAIPCSEQAIVSEKEEFC